MSTPGDASAQGGEQDAGCTHPGHDLSEKYAGKFSTAGTTLVMGLAGCTETGMERWAFGFRYDTEQVFAELADANRVHYGHETLGPFTGPDDAVYGLLIPYRRDGITGEELRARFGDQVEAVADTGLVLRLLGRQDTDPTLAVAEKYATREAFDVFADGNRRHYGHETLGPVTGDDGTIYGLIILNLPCEDHPAVYSSEYLDPVARVPDEAGEQGTAPGA